MKKFRLNSLTSIVITMAIMLSCGGYLFADDTEQPEVIEEPVIEQVEEPASDEEEPAVEEEIIDEDVASEEEGVSDGIETVTLVCEDYACDDSDYDSDYLTEQFIEQEMSVGSQVCNSIYNPQSNLTPAEVTAYNYLYSKISDIATGQLAKTVITIPADTLTLTFTPEELGIDPYNWTTSDVSNAVARYLPIDHSSMMNALLSGCPYELYWFDKSSTGGLYMAYNSNPYYYSSSHQLIKVEVTAFEFSFCVASEFRDTRYSPNTFMMDTQFGQSAEAAANNARAIINSCIGLSDYDKLLAYNNRICDLVEYNTPASRGGVAYGNPWQMIWVFDGNDETNVVCEGYSKAFQFLCDHSFFSNPELYVISVSGMAYFTNNSGPHMWNIVHMDDGYNYLVDVTNNDNRDNHLFLVGAASGSVSDGYTLSNGYRYEYEGDIKVLFTSSALTLASGNYVVPATSNVFFRGHSMQLDGQIGLQFIVELPSSVVWSDPDCYVTFADEHGHIDSSDHHELQEFSRPGVTGYYYAQVNLSTIQMAENITPTLHYVEGGVEKTLVGSPYSARDYINWGLANIDPSKQDYAIISALADYGHYSQPYLSRINRWTNDGSAYSQMITYRTESYDYSAVSNDTYNDRVIVNNLSGTGFNQVNYSLRFGNTVSLRVFLTADDISTIENSLFSITGGTPDIGLDENNRVTITFTDISATALTNRYTISYDGNEIMQISAMSYVYGMLTSTSPDVLNDGRDLVCALYYYAQACKPSQIVY